ncbi:NRDE family protein [Motiliproteus sediminis]|uniref:NRDE family protein n=1 Tax=Motiliproteus sediminis TaxID=1468178 RepID=UPI001AEFBD84|nr:NRDE family protein [Motiliproteus sediminis]
MCLIVVAYRIHPRFPLIVAANRDEFYQRPTAAAHFWPDHPQLLAGRDQRAGGTWLGLTREGRFAAITNVRNGREVPPAAPRSRGELPSRFLLGSDSSRSYARDQQPQDAHYAGYNLLLFDGQELGYHSNRYPGQQALNPGIYGLSNASLDTPWPKLLRAKRALADAVEAEEPDSEQLFRLLADPLPAPADALPDTGIAAEWEALLSSCFITSADYGTRCSTLVLRSATGDTRVLERSFIPGQPPRTRHFEWS